MPLDRRKPGMLKLTIIVSFLATFVGGITVYTVQVLAEDFRVSRDRTLATLVQDQRTINDRLNAQEVLMAKLTVQTQAQNEEILRRLTVIEELQRHK